MHLTLNLSYCYKLCFLECDGVIVHLYQEGVGVQVKATGRQLKVLGGALVRKHLAVVVDSRAQILVKLRTYQIYGDFMAHHNRDPHEDDKLVTNTEFSSAEEISSRENFGVANAVKSLLHVYHEERQQNFDSDEVTCLDRIRSQVNDTFVAIAGHTESIQVERNDNHGANFGKGRYDCV